VRRLAREPGRRESRYVHLFSGEPAEDGERETDQDAAAPAAAANAVGERLDELERRVAELEADMARLIRRLEARAGS
ncbi:MAG: DUF480 domain-containing protein, partial [Burkholderiales bacterium]